MITNYFSPLEFLVTIQRMPNVEFFVQRTELPGLTSTSPKQQTLFNPLTLTPDHLEYGDLSLSFIIDKHMNNYVEVFDWIVALTFPQKFDQFKKIKESTEGLSSDISIIILGSNKQPVIEATFVGCIPTQLSPLPLDTTGTTVEYVTASVTFSYDWYTIKKLT